MFASCTRPEQTYGGELEAGGEEEEEEGGQRVGVFQSGTSLQGDDCW